MKCDLSKRLSRFTASKYEVKEGDFYVSENGSDECEGSLTHPFATIKHALDAVSEAKLKNPTICIMKGSYRTDCLRLTACHSGLTLRAYGDGDAEVHGGLKLTAEHAVKIPDELKSRINKTALGHITAFDLTNYGLKHDDWGEICPAGKYGTENKYDDYIPDVNCELFENGKRMRLARYPSEGFLKIAEVADVGDCFEFPAQNYFFDWNNRRNHRGGTYVMDKETALHASKWSDTGKIWMYGFPAWDWADASSPIAELDAEHRLFKPRYVSYYGAYKNGQYCFYNVLEELDTPGEWYLDRENGILLAYLSKPIEETQLELSIARQSLIDIDGAENVTIEGLHLRLTRGDAVIVKGNNNVFRDMKIDCVQGNALHITGYNNKVIGCDITSTGKGGIWLEGGNLQTLEPGNNTAENNLIYDWAQVCMMYSAGVRLDGVGNRCAHNEMFNAPHAAVLYYGTDHVIEYNYIHEVVQHASDAGAVYSGQSWAWQNCTIRRNVLVNIGNEEFKADAIYFDDILSGQRAYQNLLINVAKNGFLAGGGFDISIHDNVIVNAAIPIHYDARGREGFLENGWMHKYVETPGNGAWKRLYEVPFRSDVWKSRYPLLGAISEDFSKPDDPHFPVNPAFGSVKGNYIFDEKERRMNIAEGVYLYSEVKDNKIYSDETAVTIDDAVRQCGIPLEKIGRY